MLLAYLTSQVSIIECTALIYLTKQNPAGVFVNISGLLSMWNFIDFCDTRHTMSLQL